MKNSLTAHTAKAFVSLSIVLTVVNQSLLFAQNYVGSGIALSYPGLSGSYVNLGDVYNGIDFPITVEAWIYPTSTPSYNPVFASDNNTNLYHGFVVRIDNGVIFFSMGDGTGNSPGNRRGAYSSSTIPTNRWTHIACVAPDANTWLIYLNGVQDATIPDGSSSVTSLVWSTSPAYIGRYSDIYQDSYWHGQMDEVRFWNVARSQTEIRDYMCSKIDPATSGLIGYWTADESYSSSSVNDQTIPAENGTISGSVTRITSGAPIGDTSAYTYTSNWNGVKVSASQLSGDSLVAGNVTGNPYGVQVYLVDSLPHDTIGLDTVPKFYFGVFCAQTGSTAGYDVRYHYDFNNGVIISNNESTAELLRRDDGSVTSWDNTSGTLDMINNNISKGNETTRGEYILDVKGFSGTAFSAADTSVCEKFCIDFTDQSANNPTSWQWTFEGGSPSTSNQQNPTHICYNQPGVYDVTLITSGAGGTDTLILHDYITVLSTPAAPVITQSGYTLTSSSSSSFQWQLNAVNIPGATDQSYTVLQSGYYTVIVSNENGCLNSSSLYVLISGVGEIAIENTSMFPNPAVNQISIDLSAIRESISSLRVTDAAGRVLMERNIGMEDQQLKIDVSNFPAGIYFIEDISSSGWKIGKFEVQK